jgi:hypothetical protein
MAGIVKAGFKRGIMKIRRNQSEAGGVLVVTIIVCMLVGIMLAAYLAMVSGQHNFTQRSQVWNNCIPLCEAGIEEAMAHINHINTTSNFAVNGWSFSSNAYRKNRPLNLGMARMSVDTSMPPVITVVGSLQTPITAGAVSRTVRVKTKINQRFPNGILSKGLVDLGGSGRIDSFNSTNVAESDINGQYNATNATDRASVVTTSRLPNQFQVGNVSIYGTVGTGPGGNINLSPNGNVGSEDYNDNSIYNGTVEPGHYTDDVNVYIPDATLPTPFGPFFAVSPGIVGGTNYKYVVNSGDYRAMNISLTLTEKMLITGKARIHVVGPTAVSGTAFILIAPGASVEWYAGGNVDLKGGGCINAPGLAKNFSLIGLNGCTSVVYAGNSRFIGTIYAPRASVVLTGTADAYGAIVGASVTLNGGMGLHYDESLKGDPREGRFLAASWQEL